TSRLGVKLSAARWPPGQRLLARLAYGGGSRMLQLSRIDRRTTPKELWFTNRMHLHFGGALRMGKVIIGTSGDFGPAFMVAVDADSGAEVWRDRSFARSQMIDANGTLVIVDENGDVALASVSDSGLNVRARTKILTSNAWTPPTLVGNTLYLRDRKDILALDLASGR